jgi:hypothetical protein
MDDLVPGRQRTGNGSSVATQWQGLEMARWQDFVAAEPEFAHLVQRLLSSQKHLATPRRDRPPKISGTEAKIVGGDLVLGMMGGSLKVLDLLRDPRLALHSPTFDPLEDDHGGWLGDAKVAGRAVDTGGGTSDGSHSFRVEIAEVVVTRIGTPADHLDITSWHPGRGLEIGRR